MLLLAILAIPLAAGALSFTARNRRGMEMINVGGFVALLLLAAVLATQVLRAGAVSMWDGFLAADSLSALVVLLTAFVALACSVYAVGYFREDERNHVFESDVLKPAAISSVRKYYSLTPLFVFAMLLVALANNLGVMWVAIEATTLASVFLISFYGRATSIEAAWKYTMIGGVGLSMALFGTILTYYSAHHVLETETLAGLNWSVLVVHASQFDKTTMKLAFILILLGYGTKAGIAPMHTWKPDAYSEAPVPVAAMLAAAVLNCALYGLIRFYVLTNRCLGPQFASQLLIIFGLLSVGVAVPFVLVQKSFRRLLAYSSIDHGGIMILGLGFGGALGALGMLLHLTFHSITKPLLFFCAGNVEQHQKTDLFRRAKGGVIHAMPVSGPIFLMATLAVTGTPPFSMFQSEFTILRAGFGGSYIGPAILLIVLLVAIFIGFLVHIARLVLGADPGLPPGDSCPWKKYSLICLAGLVLILGFWLPAPLFGLIQDAARVVGAQP
ncbi:MAG: hydrogenase 4 subunit F [Acidobacteriia bacterium]|nr:hydrogenase 4 subunit F [Terriglobia bacterium]